MNVSLDRVCECLREWGDLSLRELREMLSQRMGDPLSAYKKHTRGEVLALLMASFPEWAPPVCTR